LDVAIDSTRKQAPAAGTTGETFDIPDDLRRDIRAEAVRWISGLLLHELSSPIGLVELAAAQELPDYATSQTKASIDSAKRVFEAIELLKNAATGARRDTFDLGKLVDEVVFEVRQERHVEITVHGPKPMMTNADPKLLRLAIANGLRNAFDATEALDPGARKPVVVTWGVTDINHWISVIDGGIGLAHSPERAFEIGRTTKRGHSGFGLAIARQAMETLGGSASIEPATGGGAQYELKWDS
jgi:signal transduction histidine kinase